MHSISSSTALPTSHLRSHRSLSSSRASEMCYMRNSGLLGLSFSQASLIPPTSFYPSTSSQDSLLTSTYVTAVRHRDHHLLQVIFSELKLETLLTPLALKYYANRLKFRAFRTFKGRWKIPQAVDKIRTITMKKILKKYKNKVKCAKVETFRRQKIGEKAIKSWKKDLKTFKIIQKCKFQTLFRVFSAFKHEIRIQKFQNSLKYHKLLQIFPQFKEITANLHTIRSYFTSFRSFCAEKRTNRLITNLKIKVIKAKLEDLYYFRMQKRIFNRFLEFYREKIDVKIRVLMQIRKNRENFARTILFHWKFFTFRTIYPILLRRKVFKSLKIVQKRHKIGSIIAKNSEKRLKKWKFREWLRLIQSDYMRIFHFAESFAASKLCKKSLNGLIFNANQGKIFKNISKEHENLRKMKFLWELLSENWSLNKGKRFYRAFMKYRLVKLFKNWGKEAKISSKTHQNILKFLKTTKYVTILRSWLQISHKIITKQSQIVLNFRRKSLFHRLFSTLLLPIEEKNSSKYQLYREKSVFSAWKKVVTSLKMYRNKAMTLQVPSRLKIKRKGWKIEEFVTRKIRENTVKIGLKAVKIWKNAVKREISWNLMRSKRQKKVKSVCFAMLFQHLFSSFQRKISQNHHKIHLLRVIFQKLKFFTNLNNFVSITKEKIAKNQEKFAISRLFLNLIRKDVNGKFNQKAEKFWSEKAKKLALRRLFISAKSEFRVKFLQRKILNSRKPELCTKSLFSLQKFALNRRIERNIRTKCEIGTLKNCFCAIFEYKNREKEVKIVKNKCEFRLKVEFLRIWRNISGILSALKGNRPEIAVYLSFSLLPSALKLISNEINSKFMKKKTLRKLHFYTKSKKMNSQKLENCKKQKFDEKLKEIFTEWKFYRLKKIYKQRKMENDCKNALFRLQRHLKIQKYVKNQRNNLRKGLLLSWKRLKTPISLSPFVTFPSHWIFQRTEKRQIFAAWLRKVQGKRHLTSWLSQKDTRLTAAIWTIMRRVQHQFSLERARTYQLHRDLTLEMKQMFSKYRLSNLFYRQKLCLKAVKTWKMEVISRENRRLEETESVFLCGAERGVKEETGEMSLEQELSMLTAQFSGTCSTRLMKSTAYSGKEEEMERNSNKYRHNVKKNSQKIQPGQVSTDAVKRHNRVSQIIQGREAEREVREVAELQPREKPPQPQPWR